MGKKYTNPCTRCGKERIFQKSWQQRIQTYSGIDAIQINSRTICPDKACQRIVDKDLKVQKNKREKIRLDREERATQHKANNPRNTKKK